MGGKNPKSEGWNNEVKAAVRGKEMLAGTDRETKEREEKRKVKGCIYQSKKKVNEQFGRKVMMGFQLKVGKSAEM